MKPIPHRPKNLPEFALICLEALVDAGLANRIVLGGGLGLLHYLDFRPTVDIDAWWVEDVTVEEQFQVVETIEITLNQFGQVMKRAWGDVISLELLQEGHKKFNFKVTRRSTQLLPAAMAPWIDVPLDSFEDLVACKMTAQVERGDQRDFKDIYMLCRAGLSKPWECWGLWRKRQEIAGSDVDFERARLAILTHLARISQHRRLDQIIDLQARAEAEELRTWFKEQFLENLE